MTEEDFSRQYCNYYYNRLIKYLPLIKQAINKPFIKVAELSKSTVCTVIGVLFLNSSAKPLILSGKTEIPNTYIKDESFYTVEDETGKINISFSECSLFDDSTILTTGVVLGFEGVLLEGSFKCSNIIYPQPIGLLPRIDIDMKFLIFSSPIFNINYEKIIPLITYYSQIIDHVIIIGPVFDKTNSLYCEGLINLLEYFDGNIYLIPSIGDPTIYIYPLEPLHKMLFKKNERIILLSNPSQFEINGLRIIAFDNMGSMTDIEKYSRKELNNLEIINFMLKVRSLAPSAPDTIPCYPSINEDSFFIKDADLVIAGNISLNPILESYHNIPIIGVPNFSIKKSCVLYSTKSKTIEKIVFSGFNI